MSKQAVVKDGKVVVVDTETGKYREATKADDSLLEKAVGGGIDVVAAGVGAGITVVEKGVGAFFDLILPSSKS